VLDPQTEGMGEGEFDPSLFLSGWKKGNDLAGKRVTSSVIQPFYEIPTISLTLLPCLRKNWSGFGDGTMSGGISNKRSGSPYLCPGSASSRRMGR